MEIFFSSLTIERRRCGWREKKQLVDDILLQQFEKLLKMDDFEMLLLFANNISRMTTKKQKKKIQKWISSRSEKLIIFSNYCRTKLVLLSENFSYKVIPLKISVNNAPFKTEQNNQLE